MVTRRERRGPAATRASLVACTAFGGVTFAGAAFAGAAMVAPPFAGAAAAAVTFGQTTLAGLAPVTIVARAAASVRRENAFVIVGSIRQGKDDIGIDIASSGHGAVSRGSLVSRTAGVGFVGGIDFVERGAVVYLKAGSAFWDSQLAKGAPLSPAEMKVVTHLLSNHWIELTGSSAAIIRSGLGQLTSPAAFTKSLLSPGSLGTLTKGAPTTFHGHRALPVHSSKGGTIFVSMTGAPLPLGIVASGAGGSAKASGTVAFAYPRSVAIGIPTGAKTLQEIMASTTSG